MKDTRINTRIEIVHTDGFVRVYDADSAQEVCSFHSIPEMTDLDVADIIAQHIRAYIIKLLLVRFDDS